MMINANFIMINNESVNEKIQAGLGPAIRAHRDRCGFSQHELGNRLGCTRAFVSMVEHGKRKLSLDTLTRIADCFGIGVPELLQEAAKTDDRLELARRLERIVRSDDAESLKKILQFAQNLERASEQ